MTRIGWLTFAAIALLPARAAAGAADWRSAGGTLFVGRGGPAVSSETAPLFGDETEQRVPDPVQPYALSVSRAAARYGLDPKLLHALVTVESAYDASAVSPAGAAGLVQLTPGTAAAMGVADRRDVDQNLDGGARYLVAQVVRFGDLRLALAAYNAGPARVARLGRVPSIHETQAYVVAVVDCYLALTAGRSVRSSKACKPTVMTGPLESLQEVSRPGELFVRSAMATPPARVP